LAGELPRENEAGTVLEAGSVRAYLTAEKVGLEDIIYVESDSKLTYIYRVTPSYSSYLADFSWGEGDILKALAGELSTDSRLTKELYLQYVGGKVSSRVARKLDKIFYSAFGTFVNGLTMAIKNYSVADKGVFGSKVMEQGNKRQATAVYLESFPLPGTVWDRKFLVGDRKTKFAPAPGVDIDEFGDDKTNGVNERFNCLAKRRIKWLMAR
ncbi:MAG: hypothetical protein M1361_02220, partial [Patescibacteria group bacterium]|nr:hypothetical protein [Patescibacteria group bacterium]